MANSLEALDILYKAVKPIMNDIQKPSGGVYKHQRPLNSEREDIVVNSLAMGREKGIQQGVLNVNVHIPNLLFSNNGDNTQPNHARILYLTKAIETLIEEVYGDDYNFHIDQDNIFQEDKSSYNNIRVTFYSLNY